MRVVLSSITFDPAGVVPLDAAQNTSFGEQRRRMNRVPTLDGGAVFNDFGYSEADRIIKLVWLPRSAATEDAVARLLQLYTQITVASAAGLFLASPEAYNKSATESTLTLLVASKLA